MNDKIRIKMPRESLIYLAMCLGGILIFVFAGIIPYQRSLVKLDERIEKIRTDISVQEALYPLYASLTKDAGKQRSSILPMPPKSTLPRGHLEKIPAIVRETASRAGMRVTSVSPDISALSGNAEAIPVTCVMRGDFLRYRKFLLALGTIPFVIRIEQINIQQNPESLEYRTKIWFALA